MPGRESRPGNYHIKAGFFRPESPSPRGPAVRSSRSAGTAISTAVRRTARPCRCQKRRPLPSRQSAVLPLPEISDKSALSHTPEPEPYQNAHQNVSPPLSDRWSADVLVLTESEKPSFEPRSTFSDSAFWTPIFGYPFEPILTAQS